MATWCRAHEQGSRFDYLSNELAGAIQFLKHESQMSTTTQSFVSSKLRDFRESISSRSLLRSDVAASGPTWIPLVLALGAIVLVSYADPLVVPISLIYLCI